MNFLFTNSFKLSEIFETEIKTKEEIQESLKENARLLGGRELSEEAKSAADKLRREGLAEFETLKDTFC